VIIFKNKDGWFHISREHSSGCVFLSELIMNKMTHIKFGYLGKFLSQHVFTQIWVENGSVLTKLTVRKIYTTRNIHIILHNRFWATYTDSVICYRYLSRYLFGNHDRFLSSETGSIYTSGQNYLVTKHLTVSYKST
jgi:hypothetical protein